METELPFSERHGYAPSTADVAIRYEAPEWLRALIVNIAYNAKLQPSDLRKILCDLLLEAPDPSNWSQYPNIDGEVLGLIAQAEWFQVYEFVEVVAETLKTRSEGTYCSDHDELSRFTKKLNEAFRRKGVGWQLVDCRLQIRGTESFEVSVRQSTDLLAATDRQVARHEMHQALDDLSRRPTPDVTGAIQHAMAAMECVMRDVTGDPKATLGELLKKYPGVVPNPLDLALTKIWGFASEQGRHLRESDAPDLKEAELLVGLVGSIVTYLLKKLPPTET